MGRAGRRTAVAAALVGALLLPAAAGGELPADGRLTIYSSLPLRGASQEQTRAIVRGERLALAEAAGMAGGRELRLVSLDDSTSRAGGWDVAAVRRNARRAVEDETTVGYIGEFNSGASRISIPLLNARSVAQISPSNTYVGLTQPSEPGEPDVYYPNGRRTYARVIPADDRQGAALVAWMRSEKVRRVAVVHDGDLYGREMAAFVKDAARKARITVATTISTRGTQGVRAAVRKLRSVDAGALLYAGVTANGAARLLRGAHAAHRRWKLYASDGVCERGLTRALGSSAANFRCTVAPLALRDYPGGKTFVKAYRARYGGGVPDPYAIYGYEAMRLLLDAIGRAAAAGPLTREGVSGALLATPQHDSPLGPYAIDARGDTTLPVYGGYKVRSGRLYYARKLDASGL